MGNETKIIEQEFAKIPQNMGDYDELVQQGVTSFGVKERVNRYGCEFESIVENNTYAPMTWDGSETFTEDTTHWRRVTGSPEAWIAGRDKPAASEQYPYNGMGRIVLKKNMVNGVNTLTQSMINTANTVYIIQYDFTLGEDITIPANCILEFDGGSLKNGTLNCNTFHGYLITGEDGHMILDDVIPKNCGNTSINASSIGVCFANKTDNGRRFNQVSPWIRTIIMDEHGPIYGSPSTGPQTTTYYLIEQPLIIMCSEGRIIGQGSHADDASGLVPSADFYVNYPDRGVIETNNYWAGLDGNTYNPGYANNITIDNLHLRIMGRADYGICVWCCGENSLTSRCLVGESRKGNIFYGGLMAVGRIELCFAGSVYEDYANDSCGYLFGNHPRSDFQPGVAAANGGRGTGGSASLIQCSGDSRVWCKYEGTTILDIVAPKAEGLDIFIRNINTSLQLNTSSGITVTGGRMLFAAPNATHKAIYVAKNEAQGNILVTTSHIPLHSYTHIYTVDDILDNDNDIKVNDSAGDTLSMWSNSSLSLRKEIVAQQLLTFGRDYILGYSFNGGATSDNIGSGKENFYIQARSDLNVIGVYRGNAFMQIAGGRTILCGTTAGKYYFDSLQMGGTTRPTAMSLYGVSCEPAVGYCFLDTTLGKPIWYKGSGVWVDATGATV